MEAHMINPCMFDIGPFVWHAILCFGEITSLSAGLAIEWDAMHAVDAD